MNSFLLITTIILEVQDYKRSGFPRWKAKKQKNVQGEKQLHPKVVKSPGFRIRQSWACLHPGFMLTSCVC
jgi:hypothetical protein